MSRSLFAKLHRRYGPRLSGAERYERAHAKQVELGHWLALASLPECARALPNGVAIVGGGCAGMAAAWTLGHAGVKSVVFEARSRYGGRVESDRHFIAGRVVEAGAELIGLNHPMWIELAQRLGLGLTVLTSEDQYAGAGLEMPMHFDGVPVSDGDKLHAQMALVLRRISQDAKSITDPFAPWTAPHAAAWDALSVGDKIDEFVRLIPTSRRHRLLQAVLEIHLVNDHLLPLKEQSYLGLLALVSGGRMGNADTDLDGYWNDTEEFRCAEGNDALIGMMLELGRGIEFRPGAAVTAIDIGDTDPAVQISWVDGQQGTRTRRFDYVILTAPPTVWSRITINPRLPPGMQMASGPAVKYLSQVPGRFWIKANMAPSGWSNTLGQTWEGTDNQALAAQGIELTVFAGGPLVPASDPVRHFQDGLAKLYPGYKAKADRYVDWSRTSWIETGYACPRVGQVTTVAKFLSAPHAKRLYFAGEHTCMAYFGYMEGALQSGARAAKGILAACMKERERPPAHAQGATNGARIPVPTQAEASTIATPRAAPAFEAASASRLFNAFAHAGAMEHARPAVAREYAARFDVIARPGKPLGDAQPTHGDLVVRMARGEGFAQVGVVASPGLHEHGRLADADLRGEGRSRALAGGYVHVVETNPRPRGPDERFARRVCDASGIVLPDTLVLRPRAGPRSSADASPTEGGGAELLKDPVPASGAGDFGFYAAGPDFSGAPSGADIRDVLIERGIADAQHLDESTVQTYTIKGGDQRYFAYVHPSAGVVARAYGQAAGYVTQDGKSQPIFAVYAFVDASDATKYRPVGGTGPRRAPSLGAMSATRSARFDDLFAALRLAEGTLTAMSQRGYGSNALAIGIGKAQFRLSQLRRTMVASSAQAELIGTALQLLEWAQYDLDLLAKQRAKLAAESAPLRSVNALEERYADVLEKLFDTAAPSLYDRAQRWAERLPLDVMLDALRAHGELNKDLLKPSAALVTWVDDLRKKLDQLYDRRQQLAAQPGNAALGKEIQAEAAFVELGARAIELHAQQLVAFEQFLKARPGVTDTPLVDAMNRLNDRVAAIKAAYDAHDVKLLKQLVESLENDQNVKTFYRALPAAMQVTRLIAKIAITALAGLAAGGVGGLLSGGARTVVTGITWRGALTFAGTAVLEAATFTALNAVASKFLFDEKVTFGSLLKDFAWNVGLFTVLRGVGGISNAVLRSAELQALATPMSIAVQFPLAHKWGVLRFRVEQDRWPTQEELDQMTTESVLLLAGVAFGSGTVNRWLEARQTSRALTPLYREYGWRFKSLEAIRTTLAERVQKADEAGKGDDRTELDAARSQAEKLEQALQDVLRDAVKDKRFKGDVLRAEFNALRPVALDIAGELLSETLAIPPAVGLRRAASVKYSFAHGKISVLEDALSPRYKVQKSVDPGTGLRTVVATSTTAPTLTFQERGAGTLEFDPGVFDVQKLMTDLSVTSAEAQRMLWRLLNDNGITRDARAATIKTRREVKADADKAKRTADEVLKDLFKIGKLRSISPKALVDAADHLEKGGVLDSPEWRDARDNDNRRGVVGEWLAPDVMPSPAGARVLRRVTVQGDLYEDAAGTVVAKLKDGRNGINVVVAETDLVYVHDTAGGLEAEVLINVKTSAEGGMSKSATVQNANLKAILEASAGSLVKVRVGDAARYARVRSIAALDGANPIDVTKLKPGSGMRVETVGPKGAAGFGTALPFDRGQLATLAALLAERQLILSGEY